MNQGIAVYFKEGVQHIADLGGIDHMLFLLALIAGFEFKHFFKVLLLATAFTLGHAITLIPASLGMFVFRSSYIEFLIPLTIVCTAFFTAHSAGAGQQPGKGRFIMALIFGLVHGLGFSSYFRMILPEGESPVLPLTGFNLGIEAGQTLIIIGLLFIFNLMEKKFGVRTERRSLFVSGLAAGAGLLMMTERWPF